MLKPTSEGAAVVSRRRADSLKRAEQSLRALQLRQKRAAMEAKRKMQEKAKAKAKKSLVDARARISAGWQPKLKPPPATLRLQLAAPKVQQTGRNAPTQQQRQQRAEQSLQALQLRQMRAAAAAKRQAVGERRGIPPNANTTRRPLQTSR